MKMSLRSALVLFGILTVALLSSIAFADHKVFRIEHGRDYRGRDYSERELRRRVWELERAVAQLQERIYDLEVAPPAAPPVVEPVVTPWTCTVTAFGKVYSATSNTQSQARATALTQCSNATNAMHCDDMVCGQ